MQRRALGRILTPLLFYVSCYDVTAKDLAKIKRDVFFMAFVQLKLSLHTNIYGVHWGTVKENVVS